MKPFLGLSVNWDLVTRQEPPGFLKGFFRDGKDSEHSVSGELHSRISSSLSNPERIIGGNAGNAAVTLSELGVPCVLSCPARPASLMRELSKHRIFLMSGGRESSPLKCSRPDDEPEHIIFEMDNYRKIFNHDAVQNSFLIDQDFWYSLKNASYLFLGGFHCIPERQKAKVNEIADYLEKRKFRVHLEVGYGKKSLMKYATKKLIERGCVDSLGMNETELGNIGISGKELMEIKEKLLEFMQRTGLERISLHSRDYRLSVFSKNPEKNLRAAELSIQACAAKALGGIRENMGKAKKLPPSGIRAEKGKDSFIIPTRIVENPKVIVGLGDTAAVTDSFYALRG
jgi:ADP-dependent phosphofructokinase/glucokinase